MPASHDPPAFQFYPRDWIVDTRHLSRDERCRYWDALCDSWVSRSYGVATEDQWRQWLGYSAEEWPVFRETYVRMFKVKGGRWVQQRMHDERLAQQRRHERASAGGKQAQESLRAKKMGSMPEFKLQAPLSRDSTPASASASASAKKTLSRAAREDWRQAFLEFWKAYPKKVGRHASEAVWLKLQPADAADDQKTFNAIMDGLDADVAAWKQEQREAKYVPDPRTWLNQRRWIDHEETA